MIYDFLCMLSDKINENGLELEQNTSELSIVWHTDIQQLTILDAKSRISDFEATISKKEVSKSYISYICRNSRSTAKIPKAIMDIYNEATKLHFDIDEYPRMTTYIDFRFELARPFLSKDDAQFYISENPIRKEKVFKIPMVSPSTWKGNLRWTATRIFVDGLPERIDEVNAPDVARNRQRLTRLFGQENDPSSAYLDKVIRERLPDDPMHPDGSAAWYGALLSPSGSSGGDDFKQRGCLIFFPTLFQRIGMEVFNPHSRKTRAGTRAIFMECVPAGTAGRFRLLYLPFTFLNGNHKREVFDDLTFLCRALRELFLQYGFSAKKTLDYGVAKKDISGKLAISGFRSKPEAKESTQPKRKIDFQSLGGALEQIKAEAKGGQTFASFEALATLMELNWQEVK